VIASFLTNREAKLTSFNGGGGWKAVDFCVRAQEGDWVQIGYNCPDPTGYTIDFNTGPTIGFFYIYLNEVAAPYVVANRGALVSSDAVGKVKIDADDGTMSVSGELGTGTDGSKVSINRPDKWTAGIEYDFGNNLYGMRKEGTISVTAGGSTQIGFGSSATKFIDGNGEYQRGADTVWHSVNGTVPGGFTSMLFRQGNIRWVLNCDYAITDAPYNVWVTYRK
jgi:hypothetical protein